MNLRLALPLLALLLIYRAHGAGGDPVRTGIRIQLNTSGQSFSPPSASELRNGNKAKDSFVVATSVTNRSKAPITFRFSNAQEAQEGILHRIVNSSGQELWRSVENVAEEQPTTRVLKLKATWKRTIRVPLVISGNELTPGRYQLIASVGTSGDVEARTSFEITGNEEPQSGVTAVLGYVWSTGFQTIGGHPYTLYSPAAAAVVELSAVEPIDAPTPSLGPVWSGRTDATGRFWCVTAPGQFSAYASKPWDITGGIVPDMIPPNGIQRMTVTEGEISRTIVALSGPSRLKRVSAVHKVTVKRTAESPDVLWIEAVVTGRKHHSPSLLPTRITPSGILMLEAWVRSEPILPSDPGEVAFTIGARIPNVPDMSRVRVQAEQNSRDAMINRPD